MSGVLRIHGIILSSQMAQSGFAAFLLFLGLVVSNVYGDNNTDCEKILNTALTNATLPDFNLTVSPAHLSNNTVYSVKLYGTGNFTVLLRAVSQSTPVGIWATGNNNCNGSLFIDHFQSNSHINTTWTSPEHVTTVTINAYVHNDTHTFLLHHTLSQDSANATEAPITSNITESSKTAASTLHVSKTTSAGSTEQCSLLSMALIAILSLLLIPRNYLS